MNYEQINELIKQMDEHVDALNNIWVELVGQLGVTDTLANIRDALNKLDEVL